MAEDRKRSAAAALGRGKAQANRVRALNEMFEANCSGPFPGVREVQNSGKHEHDANAEFVCTACGRSVAIVEVRAHPVLHVGICKGCYDFQVSDPFTKDNPQDPFGHENECRWCGDGGFEVTLCDSCPKVFCKYCIIRNFGEEILSAIKSPPREWSCFVCNDEHLQILNRDHTQATLIGGLLQALVQDYNNVENLVKTMKRGQRQKRRMSRSDGDYSPSTDDENSNTQSSLPTLLHHQDEHKEAFTNDSTEGQAIPLPYTNHLGRHPGFYKKLKASHIGRSDREDGSNTGQFAFPMGDFMRTHGEQIRASVKFQGIHENSPFYVITCRRSSKIRGKVYLLTSEWSRFVKDNGLKVGDELHFSLDADSSFVVRKV